MACLITREEISLRLRTLRKTGKAPAIETGTAMSILVEITNIMMVSPMITGEATTFL